MSDMLDEYLDEIGSDYYDDVAPTGSQGYVSLSGDTESTPPASRNTRAPVSNGSPATSSVVQISTDEKTATSGSSSVSSVEVIDLSDGAESRAEVKPAEKSAAFSLSRSHFEEHARQSLPAMQPSHTTHALRAKAPLGDNSVQLSEPRDKPTARGAVGSRSAARSLFSPPLLVADRKDSDVEVVESTRTQHPTAGSRLRTFFRAKRERARQLKEMQGVPPALEPGVAVNLTALQVPTERTVNALSTTVFSSAGLPWSTTTSLNKPGVAVGRSSSSAPTSSTPSAMTVARFLTDTVSVNAQSSRIMRLLPFRGGTSSSALAAPVLCMHCNQPIRTEAVVNALLAAPKPERASAESEAALFDTKLDVQTRGVFVAQMYVALRWVAVFVGILDAVRALCAASSKPPKENADSSGPLHVPYSWNDSGYISVPTLREFLGMHEVQCGLDERCQTSCEELMEEARRIRGHFDFNCLSAMMLPNGLDSLRMFQLRADLHGVLEAVLKLLLRFRAHFTCIKDSKADREKYARLRNAAMVCIATAHMALLTKRVCKALYVGNRTKKPQPPRVHVPLERDWNIHVHRVWSRPVMSSHMNAFICWLVGTGCDLGTEEEGKQMPQHDITKCMCASAKDSERSTAVSPVLDWKLQDAGPSLQRILSLQWLTQCGLREIQETMRALKSNKSGENRFGLLLFEAFNEGHYNVGVLSRTSFSKTPLMPKMFPGIDNEILRLKPRRMRSAVGNKRARRRRLVTPGDSSSSPGASHASSGSRERKASNAGRKPTRSGSSRYKRRRVSGNPYAGKEPNVAGNDGFPWENFIDDIRIDTRIFKHTDKHIFIKDVRRDSFPYWHLSGWRFRLPSDSANTPDVDVIPAHIGVKPVFEMTGTATCECTSPEQCMQKGCKCFEESERMSQENGKRRKFCSVNCSCRGACFPLTHSSVNKELKLVVRRVGRAVGWGLFNAGATIPRGSLIAEYVGEVISAQEAAAREQCRPSKDLMKSPYGWALGDDVHSEIKKADRPVIDGEFRSNMARFMNHSCQPNIIQLLAEIESPTMPHIVFQAIEDIKCGEELVYCYNYKNEHKERVIRCECGCPQDCSVCEGWFY